MGPDVDQREQEVPETASLSVANIGGIESAEVSVRRGVTVLSGRNATNRTSLLRAITAALGSDRASLKADADEGHAVLEFGDETHRRTLERRNGTVVADGDPYLDDPELADLFAFLFESNEARRAVARGDDLRELIMRPVDTEAIRAEIDRCERRKRELDERLAELDDLEARLPDLEAKRTRATERIETLREELEAAREALETADDRSAVGTKLEEVREARSELERVRERIETERESVDALERERADVRERLESLSTGEDVDVSDLESEIDRLQDETERLSEEISRLGSAIQFNERLLDDPDSPLGDADRDDGAVTDRLLEDSGTITCWTCGTSVARERIETTIDQLRTARQERLEERSERRAELDERRETLSEIDENREEHRRARRRLESIDEEIDRRKERLERLTDEREELVETVDDLEAEIDDLGTEAYGDVLEQHREVAQLEFELERAERERDDVAEEIASIERRLEERERLRTRREETAEQLTSLRTRIDRIETDAVEAFNEHMENLLETLGYDNLDRIWIDRTSRDGREGRRTGSTSSFELTIVRTTADGTAYEDSIDHLSESEREVIGLVFALAGYLVHDVYETVPFMLLDSLEAIDAERIAALVEYFESYAPYLVVALLDEDARAIDVDHDAIADI